MVADYKAFDSLVKALKNNNINDAMKILQENFTTLEDLTKTQDTGRSNPLNCLLIAISCSASKKPIELVMENIVKLGDAALLKSQLSASYFSDQRNAVALCFCNPASTGEVISFLFDKLVEVGGGPELLKDLFAAKDRNGSHALQLGCANSWPSEVMKLVCDKIVEVGGSGALLTQLTSPDNHGHVPLMTWCAYSSSSPELLFDKILELGSSPEILKEQFAATNSEGKNWLTLGCQGSHSSPSVMKRFMEKLLDIEEGGPELLKKQLRGPYYYNYGECNCLTLLYEHSSLSVELMDFVYDKIIELSGAVELKNLFAAETSLLLMASQHSSSPEVLNNLCERIIQVDDDGGVELLTKLLNETDTREKTSLMLACEHSSSSEVVKILLDKIVQVGGNSLLKMQLTQKSRWNETALNLSCREALVGSSTPEVVTAIIELILEHLVKAGGTELLQTQLCTRNRDNNDFMMCICGSNIKVVPPATMKLLCEKIAQLGGNSVLKAVLVGEQNNNGLLMHACLRSPSIEVIKTLFQKFIEVDNDDNGDKSELVLLKNHLAASDSNGFTCLMSLCSNSSATPEMIELVLETIAKVGGPDLLKNQLAATHVGGWNCFMLLCFDSLSVTIEKLKIILDKSLEVGGSELQKKQFLITDKNCGCLVCYCRENLPQEQSVVDTLSFLIDTIEKIGGPDLLKAHLSATDLNGRTCLMNVCHLEQSSAEPLKLILAKLSDDQDILKKQLVLTDKYDLSCFSLSCGGYSATSPKIATIVASLLFRFDLFAAQFKKLPYESVLWLMSKTEPRIDKKWTPSAENVAEVNELLSVRRA